MTKKLNVLSPSQADPWRCVLVPVLSSDVARWKVAAERSGMDVIEWIRDRMNRIAPEAPTPYPTKEPA